MLTVEPRGTFLMLDAVHMEALRIDPQEIIAGFFDHAERVQIGTVRIVDNG
jgi:2-phosphoglycerate kinase